MGTEAEHRRMIGKAIRDRIVVEMSYVSQYRGYPDHTVRKIEPLEREGRLIRAYCRLRQDERHFRISS